MRRRSIHVQAMNEHELEQRASRAFDVVLRCARFVRAWLDRYKMLARPRFDWGSYTRAGVVDARALDAVAMNISARLLLIDVALFERGVDLVHARIAIELAEDSRAIARLRQEVN